MTRSSNPILPGETIGVLGSGQLGRMFTIAARKMGYRVHTLSPDTDSPTGHVADQEIVCSYNDLDQVRAFAKQVQVVTFEFENVPAATTAAAAEFTLVRPDGNVLHTTQHRRREKEFLSSNSFPVTPYRTIKTRDDLTAAMTQLGFPAVLKTAGFGYDGKGQSKIKTIEEGYAALEQMNGQECILEAWVNFEREVSVVAARSVDRNFTHWGVIDNSHVNHILDISISPADVSDLISNKAIEITRAILEKLDVVGVLCVEFFLSGNGDLLVNELAPRPHNSGHLTFDASMTSQFEQQLRCVCGLPMGSTQLLRPAAMVNLLGDVWKNGEPNWSAALENPNVKLHLYGKAEPRIGRKMGHITAMAGTAKEAARLAVEAKRRLQLR